MFSKKMASAPARREQVRDMVGKGLSERRALAVVRMSTGAFRYAPRPDHNVVLHERIVALALRHLRYGVGTIYLKLRQKGLLVNDKRVERIYQEAKLQGRRRKRKRVLAGERQPLVRPSAANPVWSMDFVFDRPAEGRVISPSLPSASATPYAAARRYRVKAFVSLRGTPWPLRYMRPSVASACAAPWTAARRYHFFDVPFFACIASQADASRRACASCAGLILVARSLRVFDTFPRRRLVAGSERSAIRYHL